MITQYNIGAKGETRTLKSAFWQWMAIIIPCFICQRLLVIATLSKKWGQKGGRNPQPLLGHKDSRMTDVYLDNRGQDRVVVK